MAVQVRTAPYDARFPSMNQARNCYTRYNEFYRCVPPVAHVVHGSHALKHPNASVAASMLLSGCSGANCL